MTQKNAYNINSIYFFVVVLARKKADMVSPGGEKDGMDAARVIALFCVFTEVGTLCLVIFLQTGPPRAIFIKNGTHRNTL